MATPKNIHQYPREYRDLVQKVHNDKEIDFPFSKPQLANAMKTQLYGFFKALRLFREEWENTRMRYGQDKANVNDPDGLYTLSFQADQIYLKVVGNVLEFRLRANNRGAKELIEGLGLRETGSDVAPEGFMANIDLNDNTKGFGQTMYKVFLREGPEYFSVLTHPDIENVPTWAREEVRAHRAGRAMPEANDPDRFMSHDWKHLPEQREELVLFGERFPAKKTMEDWGNEKQEDEKFLLAKQVNSDLYSETPQIASDSINFEQVISAARGQEKARLKRFKRLYERNTELFGKHRKGNDSE
jgi:hypothetical protein